MNNPSPDPTVAAMTMDMLGNVLSRADNPGRLGDYLTEEIRELTGARCVLFIQRLGPATGDGHRVVSVNPVRRSAWAESAPAHRLYEAIHQTPTTQIWSATTDLPLVALLREEGFDLSLSVPLTVGEARVGSMLVLGMPEEKHLASVVNLLDTLATIVALVLRNALFHEKQEQTIAERTTELQASNEALRRNENQVRSLLERSEQAQQALLSLLEDQKRTETALRASEERFRRATAEAPFPIMIHAEDGEVLALSRAWSELSGYSLADIPTTETWMEKAYGPHQADMRKIVTSLYDPTADSAKGEYSITCADGTRRIWDFNSVFLGRLPDGRRTAMSMAADVTERKRAEQALTESEKRYATTLAAVNDGLWEWHVPSGNGYFSPSYFSVLGYADGAFTAHYANWRSLVHPEDIDRVERDLRQSLESGHRFAIDLRMKTGAGAWLWVSTRGNSVERDAQGQVLRMAGTLSDITERKHAEQQLRETRAILQVAMDQSPAGIAIADAPSGALRYVNDAGLLVRGSDRATIVEGVGVAQYVSSWKLLDLDGRPLRTEEVPLARAVMFGETCSREFIIRRSEDDDRVVLARAAPIKDEAGTVAAGMVVFLDITERKQAEHDLQQFFDLVPDMICIADAKGTFLKVNEEWTRVLGYTKEELTAVPFTQFIHPEDRTVTHEESAKEVSGGTTTRFVNRYRAKDGTYRWFEWNATALTERRVIFAAARDITQRRTAEESLRESEQQHRLLIQHLHAGVVVHAPDTHILLANQQASVLLGLTINQMLGKTAIDPDWSFLREDGTPMPLGEFPVNRVLQSQAPLRDQLLGIRQPGTSEQVWVLVNGFPDFDTTGQLRQIVVTFVDITQRRRVEQSLRESLSEKEALLKEVHHRVKNNLQIISSLLRLQAGQIDEPSTAAVLHDMQGRIRSMALLHETLYRSGNLARVDLADYLQTVCTQALRAAARRDSGAVRLGFDLATVLVEATQAVPCGLLINELVSNSLKHAFPGERGGEIRVGLHFVEGGPAPAGAGLPGGTPRPRLRLTVADNGVGLPAGFEFKQLRSLGLQLVSDLSRQLQGKLEIAGAPGGGTVSTVEFPPQTAALPGTKL